MENKKIRYCGHHTRLKRISENVIYAEYNYKKYPEELEYAKKVCKKLLKKVAK